MNLFTLGAASMWRDHSATDGARTDALRDRLDAISDAYDLEYEEPKTALGKFWAWRTSF